MNQENRLEIQAWLDGELPLQRAAQISNLVQSNDQAKALADELRVVQSTLKNGEIQTQVIDTRDFYWSQIELQIDLSYSPKKIKSIDTHIFCRGNFP